MKIHPAAEENLKELGLDEDDLALIDHVGGDDDVLPQGLHQGGYDDPYAHERRAAHEARHQRDPLTGLYDGGEP